MHSKRVLELDVFAMEEGGKLKVIGLSVGEQRVEVIHIHGECRLKPA
jgi:hypothetical protein